MTKKILFLSHSSELYGAERVLLQTIKSLSRKEFHPLLILPRKGPFHEEAKKHAVETHVVASQWWLTEKNRAWKQPLSWLWNLKSIVRIARLIKEKDVDLVYSNSAVNFCGALAAKWRKVPHIWSIHEILRASDTSLRFLLGRKLLVAFLSAFSTRIIAYSDSAAQPFLETKKARIVPMGFKWDHGDRGLKGILREKFGLSAADFVLGSVGKIYPLKGQENLVESIGIIKKTCPDVKLVIVGDVGDKRYFRGIKGTIAALGLEKDVIFLGYQREIFGILSMLDLLVIASEEESFGRVAVEAMSVQTPVLAVRKDALAEVITAGENGFLVDSPDPKTLAEAICSIRENPERTRKVAEESARFVREKFTVENQMRMTEGIIRECLEMGVERAGEDSP